MCQREYGTCSQRAEDYGRTGTAQVTQLQRDFQLEGQERSKRRVQQRYTCRYMASVAGEIEPFHPLTRIGQFSMREIAFHEKAGRCQVGSSWFWLVTCFSQAEPPLSPPFHPHSRGAIFRSVQVGCSRFSRCCHLIVDLGSISSPETDTHSCLPRRARWNWRTVSSRSRVSFDTVCALTTSSVTVATTRPTCRVLMPRKNASRFSIETSSARC